LVHNIKLVLIIDQDESVVFWIEKAPPPDHTGDTLCRVIHGIEVGNSVRGDEKGGPRAAFAMV
jgi:hypothetical protein